MLGSVGSIVPKRWILGIFALGLIAVMVATSANPWVGAGSLPTAATAVVTGGTSVQVSWVAADANSTLPGTLLGKIVDAYTINCVATEGTVSATASGIAVTTVSVTGLTAGREYVCSVFSSSSSTLAAAGVAASAVTIPLTPAEALGSAVASLETASVQVNGTNHISVTAKGSDSGGTAITNGVTVAWSSTANGSVTPSTGTSTTYTATSDGTATVTVTVTQPATGISQSDTVTVTNFSPAADPVVETPVAPPASVIPDVPTIPSDAPEGTVAVDVITPTSGTATLETTGSADLPGTESTVTIPANSVPNGVGASVVSSIQPLVSPSALPSGVETPSGLIGDISLTINVLDIDGNDVTLLNDVTVKLTFTASDLGSTDVTTLALFKTDDPSTGTWTELSTDFTIVNDTIALSAKTRNFSTFRIGLKTRDIGTSGGGAVLPSAGDAAPTTTQALLVTGMGLLLIVGGGVYVRRQRWANGTV